MVKNSKRLHTISIRLHTEIVKDYDDVLKDMYKANGSNPAVRTPISSTYGKGVAFSLIKQTSRPTWATDFESLVLNKVRIPDSEYSKAVIVLKVTTRGGRKTRFMSIAFGYGDALLDNSKYETDFGRSIAAQKIPESGVLSAGTVQISDAIIQMEKQYTGTKTGGIQQLVGSQSEFPNSIAGSWRNGAIETKLEGRDSLLKAKRQMDLTELVNDLKVYLEAYLNPTQMADWATRLTTIKAGELKTKLDESLMKQIILSKTEYSIAWPNYLTVDRLTTDLRKDMPSGSPSYQLSWYIQERLKKDSNYGISQLLAKIKKSKLKAINMDGNESTVPLYNAIFAELICDQQHYLLFSGSWYKVAESFYRTLTKKIETVSKYEKSLPELGTEINADGHMHYISEGSYNSMLATEVEGGVLFDKVNFSNKRGEQFFGVEEPADVITNKKELFFVKKGDSSAALSHLFLQGLVSAKLLAQGGDGEFRKFVNNNLKTQTAVFADNTPNSEITLIFVIIKNNSRLPFFSMVSFSEVLSNLQEMGYKVKIGWASKAKLD